MTRAEGRHSSGPAGPAEGTGARAQWERPGGRTSLRGSGRGTDFIASAVGGRGLRGVKRSLCVFSVMQATP